ncbi:MAG: nucleotidyltransferase [Bacteroidetes bacterium]|nr:MAG: nucleotidyltransferase [Bacteroidota bacterium]
MNIIIPMAGRGSRLRPHTLTVPKPLVPVAGKPMVQRIVEDLMAGIGEQVDTIAFVIKEDFGKAVEKQLTEVAEKLGARGRIFYQDEPLGTAHAIMCARECLTGPCVIAFADTVFRADFKFDLQQDGYVWVQKVEDPRPFGVIKLDENGVITDFVEKSPVFVSDLAIVGIYYVREGETLRDEMQYLLDNDIREKGEYQLTNALENMRAKGFRFKPAMIEEWLDCGNKDNVVYTNRRVLEIKKDREKLRADSAKIINSTVIEPCFIGENVQIINSVVGPHVSIGNNSVIENCVIKNTLIQQDTTVRDALLADSMIGNQVEYQGSVSDISIGDFTKIKQ